MKRERAAAGRAPSGGRSMPWQLNASGSMHFVQLQLQWLLCHSSVAFSRFTSEQMHALEPGTDLALQAVIENDLRVWLGAEFRVD
jgi:hypothetical protein